MWNYFAMPTPELDGGCTQALGSSTSPVCFGNCTLPMHRTLLPAGVFL